MLHGSNMGSLHVDVHIYMYIQQFDVWVCLKIGQIAFPNIQRSFSPISFRCWGRVKLKIIPANRLLCKSSYGIYHAERDAQILLLSQSYFRRLVCRQTMEQGQLSQGVPSPATLRTSQRVQMEISSGHCVRALRRRTCEQVCGVPLGSVCDARKALV